jgi:hypothetical protein
MCENKYTFIPLTDPVVITKQNWRGGTLPFVSTSTLTFNHASYYNYPQILDNNNN